MDYLMDGEETARLLFRKLTPQDFNNWLPFHQNPKSSQYWSGIPKDPVTACNEQFDRIFERYKNGLGGMNAIVDRISKKLVGLCGLLVQNVDEKEELEIGYSILPEHWGKGYASEAAIHCKKIAFKNDWAPYLISIIQVDNTPSQKVALNNGMHLWKTTLYKKNKVHIFRIDQQ